MDQLSLTRAVGALPLAAGMTVGNAGNGGVKHRPVLVLAVVAVAYTAAQLIASPPWHFLGPDESIYYSQFAPGVPAAYMSAPRAWGVPLLAAPVDALTGSIIALRLYLSVLSGLGLFLAFWAWLKLPHPQFRHGLAVPSAAALFAALWVSLFYGPELMPNLPTALCTVGAVGLFLQAAQRQTSPSPRWPSLIGLTAAFAGMALLRPTEALPPAAVLCVVAVFGRPWRQLRAPAAVAAGTAIGWVPWIIESQIRFGGLTARLHQNSQVNEVGWHFTLLRHLQAFSSLNSLCRDDTGPSCGHVSVSGVLIWTALAILVTTGLWAARHTPAISSLALATITAAGCAFPYLFYTGVTNPRFLLPVYALLTLPAAHGLWSIASRNRISQAAAVTAMVLFATTQFAASHHKGTEALAKRAVAVKVAARLTQYGIHPGCTTYGAESWQIAVAAKCHSLGDKILFHLSPAWIRATLTRQAKQGTQGVLLSPSAHDNRAPAHWTPHLILLHPTRYLYLP